MRVLVSTIGSRGEVQPVVALASRMRTLGHEVRVCVPPDFREWIEGLGIPVTPIGPELRGTASSSKPMVAAKPSPELRRRLAEGTVVTQFATIPDAARGCDVLVGCGALQIAARSVAESLGIRYVHAHFCPVTLPSPHHAPPPIWGWTPDETDHHRLWELDAQRWNDTFGAVLNANRASLGLAPVEDVRDHLVTDRPWLAADPTLGPWPGPEGVLQTGAWLLPDERPLPAELSAFLDAGAPPVYFGFGSIRTPDGLGQVMIQTARKLGLRAILSRGWAGLSLIDDEPDCIAIGEVNQQALFGRVAAVVHHGGAGTTTAAARAGAPQVVIPQMYDQHYWAGRVDDLEIGSAHAPGAPTTESLVTALDDAMGLTANARFLAPAVHTDGVQVAADSLLSC